MKTKNKIIGLGLVVAQLMLTSAYAGNGGWLFKQGKKDLNSQFHFRYPEKFQDDITSDQDISKMKLTKAQQHQALVWELTQQEEKRYVALMKNRSGFFYGDQSVVSDVKLPGGGSINFSHHVTPVEVLGMNAATDTQREKYAEKDAKQQFQYLAKYLSYLADYNHQSQALKDKLKLPVIRKFDYSKYSPYNYQPVILKNNDVLMLFVDRRNSVRPIMSSLLSSIEKNPSVRLNVYFVGDKITKKSIEEWAQGQNLPPKLVKDRQITLNFDHGKFSSIKTDQKVPALVLIRNGNSRFVDIGKF